jgi:hypothetical protein
MMFFMSEPLVEFERVAGGAERAVQPDNDSIAGKDAFGTDTQPMFSREWKNR